MSSPILYYLKMEIEAEYTTNFASDKAFGTVFELEREEMDFFEALTASL